MITAIFQARMGSTRLPNKTLDLIEGKSLLWHIVERIKFCKLIDNILIATTIDPSDDAIAEFCQKNNLKCYRGSINDVLDRYYQAAKLINPKIIVRVTADDPFKDPEVTDQIIHELKNNQELDYVSNTIEPTFPEGIDIEAFRFKALEKAWKEAKKPSEREHVTPYIWQQPNKFNIKNITYKENLSKLRWTIDYPEDMKFAKEVFKQLYKKRKIFIMQDILNLLKKHPEIQNINSSIEQRTWFKKAEEQDKQ